jgi:hypothetical protein
MASSLSFVEQKLHDSGVNIDISGQEAEHIERLGGRASDLEIVGIFIAICQLNLRSFLF